MNQPQNNQPVQFSNPNNIQKEPLRWFFVAHFKDGTTLVQPENDHSIKHVEGAEHNPSAFTDVLEREDELVAFELLHGNGQEKVMVDLITGAFMINGTPFHAHDQFFEPTEHKLKLIYHRETRMDHDMQGQLTRHYVNRYFLGWQQVGGKQKAIIGVG